MSDRVFSTSLFIVSAAALSMTAAHEALAQCSTHQGNSGTVCCQPVGPDVIVGVIQSNINYSAEQVPAGSGIWFDAFSFGTTSCNIGNVNLRWNAFPNNQHPAIAQGLYKYKTVNGSGRYEQVGQSWLKHGFTALTENACGCGCSGQGGSVLGIGCSDPYTAARNGTQNGMGPKWQVDASAGYFPSIANPPFSGSTARRLRVRSAEMEASNAAVRYFVECQYVTQDDAFWGNKNNNASYREVAITGGPNEFNVSGLFLGNTIREQASINAWQVVEPGVTIRNVVTPETPNPLVAAPNQGCCTTGLVVVASKATDLGNGTWHYEFAVQNVNSERSIGSFSVPLDGNIQLSNIGFHDVDYHSNDGEGSVTRDGTDWSHTVSATEIKWQTTPYANNTNANAIKWGTMYNFRFDANSPPTTGPLALGTWKVVGTVQALNSVVPSPVGPVKCISDINGDNQTNVADLLAVIGAWGACPGCPADVNNDGQVNVSDLLIVIGAWGPCP
jgi:hypothetical protein